MISVIASPRGINQNSPATTNTKLVPPTSNQGLKRLLPPLHTSTSRYRVEKEFVCSHTSHNRHILGKTTRGFGRTADGAVQTEIRHQSSTRGDFRGNIAVLAIFLTVLSVC